MSLEAHKDIRSIHFKDPIWNLLYNKTKNVFFVVERAEKDRSIQIWEVLLERQKKTKAWTSSDQWEYFVASEGDFLYSKVYQNEHDPSRSQLFRHHLIHKKKEEVDTYPRLSFEGIKEPMIYEFETAYHKTLSMFLGLDLPLSSEYLEIEDHIIISYYLRLSEGFDRYLLLVKNGKKLWKVKQDHRMKGFSSGSFFVFKHLLIFVKNRNEICFFPL